MSLKANLFKTKRFLVPKNIKFGDNDSAPGLIIKGRTKIYEKKPTKKVQEIPKKSANITRKSNAPMVERRPMVAKFKHSAISKVQNQDHIQSSNTKMIRREIKKIGLGHEEMKTAFFDSREPTNRSSININLSSSPLVRSSTYGGSIEHLRTDKDIPLIRLPR